ncbi:glutathione S-transferase N-terminal domain-containing protein [Candidatus Propionivibrio aalborgensis]
MGTSGSPYVRRVAVSLQLLGLNAERRSISAFSIFDQFQ